MDTMERTIESMNAKVTYIGRSHKWSLPVNRYGLAVHFGHEFATFDYFQGLGITTEPKVLDILECLFNDATSINDFKGDNLDGFFSWCEEYGETPSRDLYDAYKAIQENTENLVRLFGQTRFDLLWEWFNNGREL